MFFCFFLSIVKKKKKWGGRGYNTGPVFRLSQLSEIKSELTYMIMGYLLNFLSGGNWSERESSNGGYEPVCLHNHHYETCRWFCQSLLYSYWWYRTDGDDARSWHQHALPWEDCSCVLQKKKSWLHLCKLVSSKQQLW